MSFADYIRDWTDQVASRTKGLTSLITPSSLYNDPLSEQATTDTFLKHLIGDPRTNTLPGLGLSALTIKGVSPSTPAHDLDLLTIAKQAHKQHPDLPQSKIFSATGWYKDPIDSKWRQETPDPTFPTLTSSFNQLTPASHADIRRFQLQRVLPPQPSRTTLPTDPLNPPLNPNITRTTVIRGPSSQPGPLGYYSPSTNAIQLSGATPQQLKSGLLHESQHSAQSQTNLTPGTSPSQVPPAIAARTAQYHTAQAQYHTSQIHKLLKQRAQLLNDPNIPQASKIQQAKGINRQLDTTREQLKHSRSVAESSSSGTYEAYQGQKGEVEARNVESRASLTSDQRRMSYPPTTEDIPSFLQWASDNPEDIQEWLNSLPLPLPQ